ncbi:MAG: hypothetical protein CVU64_16175 [Deltaproteobacteria bacterium HGW-Deltaproteobacteria-21]|nr:MAG: hypothetical protein CVU64_16175 [Deltaproteobacteria bacterium HGW-Deltaproteobacteria-21]
MKGFTLLEVLIATVLTALILSAVYGAYTTGVESVQTARETARMNQTARALLEMMKREIQCAAGEDLMLLRVEDRELDGRPADRIELITTASQSAAVDVRTGLYRVAYEMMKDPKGEGYVLYRTQEPLAGETAFAGRQFYQLSRWVWGFDLAYQDREGNLQESWTEYAEGMEMLPMLLKLKLMLKTDSGQERVFTMAVHPELAGPPL